MKEYGCFEVSEPMTWVTCQGCTQYHDGREGVGRFYSKQKGRGDLRQGREVSGIGIVRCYGWSKVWTPNTISAGCGGPAEHPDVSLLLVLVS